LGRNGLEISGNKPVDVPDNSSAFAYQPKHAGSNSVKKPVRNQ
jgi:hypothetical protein